MAGLVTAAVLLLGSKVGEQSLPPSPAVAMHVNIAGPRADGGWPDVWVEGRSVAEIGLKGRLDLLLRREPDAVVSVSAPPDLPYAALQQVLVVFVNSGLEHVRFGLPDDRWVAMRTWRQPITQPQGGLQLDVELRRENDRTVVHVAGEQATDVGQPLIDLLARRPETARGQSDVVLHPRRDVPYLDAVKAYESAALAGFARVFFAVAE